MGDIGQGPVYQSATSTASGPSFGVTFDFKAPEMPSIGGLLGGLGGGGNKDGGNKLPITGFDMSGFDPNKDFFGKKLMNLQGLDFSGLQKG